MNATLVEDPRPTQAQEVPRGLSRKWAAVWVLLLTAVAGALRFAWLGYPDLWLDEAATYARTRGTFEQLMRVLATDGFTPLHYWVTWLVGQYTTLTAWTLRAMPAVAGTLMVPVIYSLARRLGLRREAAVSATLLMAVSAWGFTYARDAKMYAPTWLLMTLGWVLYLGLRRGRPRGVVMTLRWLAWTLVSAAAIGYHGTAAISVALQVLLAPVLMGCGWRQGWTLLRLPAIGLGAVLIAAGPAYYYWQFNDYIQRTGLLAVPTTSPTDTAEQEPDWRSSGIQWVQRYNEGISPGELALNSATSHLLGVQWPRERVDPGYFTAPPPTWFVNGLHVAAAWLGLTLVAAALPWKRNRPMPWQGAMVLAVWVVVPTYGVFYCRSFRDFAAPWDGVPTDLRMWLTAAGAAAALVALGTMWRGLRPVLAVLLLVGGLGLVGYGIYIGGWNWRTAVVGWLAVPWALGVVVAAAAAGAFLGSGDTLRTRLRGLAKFSVAASVVLGLCAACWAFWTWQQARVPEGSWQSIWMPRYIGVIWPGLVLAVAALLDRLPLAAWQWASVAVLAGLNTAQITARLVVQTEPPHSLMAADFVQHQQNPDSFRVIYGLTDRPGLRMGGWDLPLSVHLHIATGLSMPPEDIFASRIVRELRFPADRPTREVARGLSRQPPEVLVIWQRLGNGVEPSEPLRAGVEGGLAGWRLADQQRFTQYQFWTWREGHTWVRWEYHPAADDEAAPSQ